MKTAECLQGNSTIFWFSIATMP